MSPINTGENPFAKNAGAQHKEKHEEESLQHIAARLILEQIEEGKLEVAVQIAEKMDLSESLMDPSEKLLKAARKGMMKDMDSPYVTHAVKSGLDMAKWFHLTDEFFADPRVQSAAGQLMTEVLTYSGVNTDAARKVAEDYQLSEKAVKEAVKEGVAILMAKELEKNARKTAEAFHLTDDEIQSATKKGMMQGFLNGTLSRYKLPALTDIDQSPESKTAACEAMQRAFYSDNNRLVENIVLVFHISDEDKKTVRYEAAISKILSTREKYGHLRQPYFYLNRLSEEERYAAPRDALARVLSEQDGRIDRQDIEELIHYYQISEEDRATEKMQIAAQKAFFTCMKTGRWYQADWISREFNFPENFFSTTKVLKAASACLEQAYLGLNAGTANDLIHRFKISEDEAAKLLRKNLPEVIANGAIFNTLGGFSNMAFSRHLTNKEIQSAAREALLRVFFLYPYNQNDRDRGIKDVAKQFDFTNELEKLTPARAA